MTADNRLLPGYEEAKFVDMWLDDGLLYEQVIAARQLRLDELYGSCENDERRTKGELAFMNRYRGSYFIDYCGVLIRLAFPTERAAKDWTKRNYKTDYRWHIINPKSD